MRLVICRVDYRDVTEVAAKAITGDELDCGTFELCAPGMPRTLQAAAITRDALAHYISIEQILSDEYPRGSARRAAMRLSCA